MFSDEPELKIEVLRAVGVWETCPVAGEIKYGIVIKKKL